MDELVLDINAIPAFLENALHSQKVKVREVNRVITIVSAEDANISKNYSCPFLGIDIDSEITVDKFLEWKREDREYEKEIRS